MNLRDVRAIFLDYDGVINNVDQAKPKWESLVGEYFPPRLGGTREDWILANRGIFPGVYNRLLARLPNDGSRVTIRDEFENYKLDWLSSMRALVGQSSNGSDAEDLAMAREAQAWMIPRAASPMPGLLDLVFNASRRFALYTASAGLSSDLASALAEIGVAEKFNRFYGSDLVDTPKLSSAYYRRIFEDAGIEPRNALVIDDTARCALWAREAGAHAILVNGELGSSDGITRVHHIKELTKLLDLQGDTRD